MIILGKYIRLYKPSKIRYRSTTLTLSQGHWGHLKSQIKVKFPKKGIKTLIIGCFSEAVLPTDFILCTKVQPYKAHSMTQVPMTLTLGQGHRSRSNFSKMGKNQRTVNISNAISPTDFILGTKVQPNKTPSMTQVPMTLTLGQGQRSRSNFPKNGKKLNNWPYFGCYFTYRLHTW